MDCVDVFLVLAPLCNTKLPPLSLAYLSEYLSSDGHTVQCYDLNIALFHNTPQHQSVWNIQYNVTLLHTLCEEELNTGNPIIASFLCDISTKKPKIVSFSLYKNNREPTFHLMQLVQKECPEVAVVCGGPEVMACLERGEDIPAEYMICGEGERALSDLAMKVKSDEYVGKGKFERDTAYEDANTIPFPTFRQLDRDVYEYKKALPLLMSRGCIRACAFCSERLLYDSFKIRNATHVIAEIEHHIRHYNVRQFVFYDSLINGNLQELECLCDALIEMNTAIVWEAQCVIRIDMNEALLKKMKKAGCYNLFVGLESGSDSVLSRMKKGFSTDDANTFFSMLTKAGLHFEVSLITDFPEETEEEFEETRRFLKAHKHSIPKIAQLNPFIPYEGTEILHALKGDGRWVREEEKRHKKMRRMIETFDECGIPYTKSYIGNLLAQ